MAVTPVAAAPTQPTNFAGLEAAFLDAQNNGRLRVLRTPVTGLPVAAMYSEARGAFLSAFIALGTLETGIAPDTTTPTTAMSDFHWKYEPSQTQEFEALVSYISGGTRRRR